MRSWRFVAYLRGIETRDSPNRRGELRGFVAYLRGIETNFQWSSQGPRMRFVAYLRGIETEYAHRRVVALGGL